MAGNSQAESAAISLRFVGLGRGASLLEQIKKHCQDTKTVKHSPPPKKLHMTVTNDETTVVKNTVQNNSINAEH
jgi:hypothetical protein